uniref:dTDP-glucose 4,6-dehydratase n=1 Tax=Geobacter sp. (strain M21) TaxID=443144 RepID=C6E1D0_GEOSM
MIPRIFSLMVGVWLMAAPAVLGYSGHAAVNDRICGPLIVTFATTAFWEATRGLRFLNLLLGFWLMIAPLLLYQVGWVYAVNSVFCAFVLIFAGVVPGKRVHTFGGGWPSLFE